MLTYRALTLADIGERNDVPPVHRAVILPQWRPENEECLSCPYEDCQYPEDLDRDRADCPYWQVRRARLQRKRENDANITGQSQ